MTSQVKLYVYDLSNGMAKQLSRQLTGRQIDGIWYVHPSDTTVTCQFNFELGIHPSLFSVKKYFMDRV